MDDIGWLSTRLLVTSAAHLTVPIRHCSNYNSVNRLFFSSKYNMTLKTVSYQLDISYQMRYDTNMYWFAIVE